MKKLLFMILVIVVTLSCGERQTKTATQGGESKDFVEILYFHGSKRCSNCRAVERLTKEIVESKFSEQIKSGDIVFKVIDISTNEGEKIAEKYEVAWASLYINKKNGDKIKLNNLTEFAFRNVGNPDIFRSEIEKKIAESLK